MHFAVSLLLRSAVILGAAELLRHLPRQTASCRHRLLVLAFACLALWPLLAAVLPELRIPLWPHLETGYRVTVEQTSFAIASPTPVHAPPNWPLIIWLSGVCLVFAPTLIGYRNVLRLARGAKPLTDASWTNLVESLCRQCNLRPVPEILIAATPIMPLTFGLFRRRILLLSTCGDWTELRRRAVLMHELSHLRRRDLATQLFANVVAALWWFQLYAGSRAGIFVVKVSEPATRWCSNPASAHPITRRSCSRSPTDFVRGKAGHRPPSPWRAAANSKAV